MKRRKFLKQISRLSIAPAAVAAAGWCNAAPSQDRPSKIKIGQIGTGHGHAAGKLETMRKLSSEFEVVGVVEPDQQRRMVAQKDAKYRGVTWMSEQQLLGTSGLQAVAVETEVRDLVPTAMRCISAGVHVHLDKPAGESLAPFQALLDTATQRRLVVQMGYMFRYNPAFQFLFQAVKAGWLGNVFELHGVISKTIDDRARRKLLPYAGGSMFELGCHLIDAVVALLGKPQDVTPYLRKTRPDKDELFDNGLAVFEYPQATATIRSALVEVTGQRRRQLVVCGDKGTIVIRPLEPPHLELTLAEPRGDFAKGTHQVKLPPLTGRYDGDFFDLAQIIRGEKQPDYSPTHDLAVHEAVLRASGLPLN